jgi:transcriptional regulator with XRE-family HTH domain
MAQLQPVRARILIAADRRAREQQRALGGDLRRLREDAGLSISAVARAAAVSAAQLSRLEAGDTASSRRAISRVAAVLGADYSERLFPRTGPTIRDRHQTRILEALLGILHPRWARLLELPIYRPVRGVIDLVLDAPPLLIATEIESQLRRIEQQLRWSHQKADGLAEAELGSRQETASISRLLILRSTVATRDVARSFNEIMRAEFPSRSRDAYAALTGEAPWPGAALLWASVDGSQATILEAPPRGVELGR